MLPQNRILIIRGGAIGDFILTLPVFSALRAAFPGTRLEVLGYPRVADLALKSGLVDAVRGLEDRPVARFFARGADLDSEWQRYFGSFAIIISYLFDPDGIFEENIKRCSKAQFLKGIHRPPDSGSRHATQMLLEPLERLAIFDADPVPQLALDASVLEDRVMTGSVSGARATATDGSLSELECWLREAPTLAVHPGSGSEKKNWPMDRWKGLLESLAEQAHWRILIVGGEAEGDRLDSAGRWIPEARRRVVRSLPLASLGRLMASCAHFLGHDSGVSHLAAAVGCSCSILWGPTSETVWRPRGDKVWLLKCPEGLSQLSVPTVLAALRPTPAL